MKKLNLVPYQQEHKELVDAIRAGKLLNETKQLGELCLAGIMGSHGGVYSKKVTWDFAMKSKLNLLPPDNLAFGSMEIPKVAIPGMEPLI